MVAGAGEPVVALDRPDLRRVDRDGRRGPAAVVNARSRNPESVRRGGLGLPTAGFANPTLTVVALAIRLADHLKG